MENGESSVPLEPKPIWAKLVPFDESHANIELREDEMVISSEPSLPASEKSEWCKITRSKDLNYALLQNKSSAVVLVDKLAVESGNMTLIKCGSEIIADPDSGGALSYRFLVMPTEEPLSKRLKVSVDAQHANCSICLSIWHDVVTAAPCLHSFCNGCFSEWLKTCRKSHSSVRCPQCRAPVQFVGKNHFLKNIEEEILRADPSLERAKEDLALLDSYASIRSPLVIGQSKNSRKRRTFSSSDEESSQDSRASFCPQCDTVLGGFQCNQNTHHLQCQACGGMMPSRASEITVPQLCLGCDRSFCAAYWHAYDVTGTDTHPICGHENFRPISERSITRIPSLAHERNRHEQDITENCIRRMGRTLQDVISEWITKLGNREIDRARMPLNHVDMITPQTHVCDDCYDKLVSFLLYWFRITLPKHLLPPGASQREDCWYGYACRTQRHNEEHARKRNHVCRPTRGYRA